jgi:flagellar biosynthesis/type III secretory pathway chaperone
MGAMHSDYREVMDHLETETTIYSDLLLTIERERKVMLGAQLDPLERVTAEKETLLQRLQAVERQRQESVERLAEKLSCAADELTLEHLARAAPPPLAVALSDRRKVLSGLLERLRMENQRNATLARHAAGLLRSIFRVIRDSAGHNEAVYLAGGRMRTARLNGALFSHET